MKLLDFYLQDIKLLNKVKMTLNDLSLTRIEKFLQESIFHSVIIYKNHNLCGSLVLSISKPRTTTHVLYCCSYYSAKQWNAFPDELWNI